MAKTRRWQRTEATWMGLEAHPNLDMLVYIGLVGGLIIWINADTELRIETPTGGWRSLWCEN